MASLSSSAVRVIRSWTEGGVSGKERICKRVALTLTGQGGLTNVIPAAAFGFRVIEEVSNCLSPTITLVGKVIIPAVTDGDNVYLSKVDVAGATGFETGNPADWNNTGDFLITVKGY